MLLAMVENVSNQSKNTRLMGVKAESGRRKNQTKKYGRKGPQLLRPGIKLNDHYTIENMIGGGGFGQIYLAVWEAKGSKVAVKAEPVDREPGRMILEQQILQQLRGNVHVPVLYSSGTYENVQFIVMELLGHNLSILRKVQTHQRFTPGTVMRIMLQATEALKFMHDIGYIHRDIKPGNFCVGADPTKSATVFLVDYGLARKFKTGNGEFRRERKVAGFRGTLKYVSLNVHEKKDQGCADDFISLFYMAYEMGEGGLPWRHLRAVGEVKQAKMDFDFCKAVKSLPPSFNELFEYLSPLTYQSQLDYAEIERIIKKNMPPDVTDTTQYDWEANNLPEVLKTGC